MRQWPKQRSFPAALVGLAGSVFFWLGAAPAGAQCTGCPNPSFGPVARGFLLSTNGLHGVVSADVDRDGHADLVSAGDSGFSSGRLTFLYGAGGGQFEPAIFLDVPVTPRALAVADFTGDGLPDLLATNAYQSGFHLLRATGVRTFEPAQVVAPSIFAMWIVTGDFNGDGKLDFATSANTASPSLISFFFGNGAGAFSAPVEVPAGPGVGGLTTADFNGDGRTDVVAVNSGGSTVSVVLGVAAPPFAPATNYVVGSGPSSSAAGDFNADGKPDLAVSSSQDRLSILLGTGDGSFSPPTNLTVSPGLAVAADFNGDAKDDIAVVAQSELTVLTGNGAGGFAFSRSPGWIGTPLVADFTDDGISDLMVANSASVFPGGVEGHAFLITGSPLGLRLPTATAFPDFFNSASVVAGSFNNDSIPDLAVFSQSAFSVRILLGTGTGTFAAAQVLSVGGYVDDLLASDLNLDGRTDIVALQFDRISIFLASPTGQFGSPSSIVLGFAMQSFAAGLLNADAFPDLVVANSSGDSIAILHGLGDGGFQPTPTKFAVGDNPKEIVLAHLDADAHLDLLLVTGESRVTILRGNGQGGFLSIQSFEAGGTPRSPALADFNGDGKKDLALLTADPLFFPPNPEIALLLGDGLGAFAAPSYTSLTSPGQSLVTADFNQDGAPDLFVAGPSAGVVFRNSGGVFSEAGRYWVGKPFQTAVVADFVPDGLPDVVAVGSAQAVVTLPNTNCRPVALAIETQPATCVVAGGPLNPAVRVQDDGGNTVTCDSGLVNAALVPGTGAPLAVLGGTAAVAAVGGIASFTNLFLDREGAGYRIEFTHPGGGSIRSRLISTNPSALVSAPAVVCPYSTGHVASVPDAGPGATYAWSISNGVITSGAGTRSVTFRAGPSHRVFLSLTIQNQHGCVASTGRDVTISPDTCTPPLSFFTVTPCRLVDTREPAGPDGGPALSPGVPRTFVAAGRCGIPATAKALSLNVTVPAASDPGHVTLYPAETPPAATSVINYRTGQTRANSAILPLGAGVNLTAECAQPGGTVHLILDVTGYFE